MKRLAEPALMLSLALAAFLPAGALASAPGTVSPYMRLGYSPTSLTAVTQGTPVYTVGDELWAMSDYNQSVYVNVVPPNASTPVVSLPVSPHTAVRLHVFGPEDTPGIWVMGVSGSNSSFGSVAFGFERLPSLAPPYVAQSAFEPNGTLSLLFRANLGNESGAQGCMVGSRAPTTALIPYPKDMGSGTIALAYVNGSVRATPETAGAGQSQPAFDFWVQLYYAYSYLSPSNTEQLVESEVLAAGTQATSIGGPSQVNQSLGLSTYVHLRAGRYELRAFFRNANGLSVYETGVVIDGGRPWLWLGGCEDIVDMASASSVSGSVSGVTASWPSGIYSMADVGGVEGILYSPLALNLSRISLNAQPWGGPVPASISARVLSAPAGSSCAVYNSTVYCDLRAVPAALTLQLGYGGNALENSSLAIGSQHYVGSLGVPLGELLLKGEAGGSGLPNASVSVAAGGAGGRVVVRGRTGQNGTAAFLLLAGNYDVSLRYGSYNTSVEVRVAAGSLSEVDVAVPQNSPAAYAYILLAVGAAGVAINVWVWRGVFGRKR